MAVGLAFLLVSCGAPVNETTNDSGTTQNIPTGSSSDPDAEEGQTGQNNGEQDAHEVGVDPAPELGDSAVEEMTSYVMEMLNSSEPTAAADWDDRLDARFLAEVSAEELAVVINEQLQPAAPWILESFTVANDRAGSGVIASNTGRLSLELTINPETERIDAFLFTPAPEAGDSVGSFDELSEQLDALPVDATMIVVENGETLYARESEHPMPISSTSKLYVLYALAQSIEAGEARWDDTLTVTDELRSLPSGVLQEKEDGHNVSVFDAALKMISLSDNTATDMLLDYLGRETVEEAVTDSGHHDPALMRPYLLTSDMLHLRWAEPALGEQYVNGDEDQRREIVTSLEGDILDLKVTEVTPSSGDEQEVEWYATAQDVVAVQQALQQMREQVPELTEILGTNPGLVREPEDPWWDEVAFKGGGNLGAQSGSWTLTNGEGRERTVVVLIQGDNAAEVMQPVFGLAQDAFTVDE